MVADCVATTAAAAEEAAAGAGTAAAEDRRRQGRRKGQAGMKFNRHFRETPPNPTLIMFGVMRHVCTDVLSYSDTVWTRLKCHCRQASL